MMSIEAFKDKTTSCRDRVINRKVSMYPEGGESLYVYNMVNRQSGCINYMPPGPGFSIGNVAICNVWVRSGDTFAEVQHSRYLEQCGPPSEWQIHVIMVFPQGLFYHLSIYVSFHISFNTCTLIFIPLQST